MSDQQIEQEIQAKGLTAPRITPADVQANIASEFYFTADEGVRGASGSSNGEASVCQGEGVAPEGSLKLLTFCVLALKNGFTVTGESACASPENFDAEIGRKIARENAINKVWALMGYALKQHLHEKSWAEAEPEQECLHDWIDNDYDCTMQCKVCGVWRSQRGAV